MVGRTSINENQLVALFPGFKPETGQYLCMIGEPQDTDIEHDYVFTKQNPTTGLTETVQTFEIDGKVVVANGVTEGEQNPTIQHLDLEQVRFLYERFGQILESEEEQ